MIQLALLNGPNLNRLGKREPEIYGSTTLHDVEQTLTGLARERGAELTSFQSNSEGELIDKIYDLVDSGVVGIIFNPGAYTHTSIALRDAISSVDCMVIEVHISNVHSREEFRHTTLTGQVSLGVIAGLGVKGYTYALEHLLESFA